MDKAGEGVPGGGKGVSILRTAGAFCMGGRRDGILLFPSQASLSELPDWTGAGPSRVAVMSPYRPVSPGG